MQQYFNPRSPHGERRRCEAIPAICSAFQSTLPAWGATPRSKFIARIRIISIHAPRMGSDLQAKCDSAEADVFQSTPPRMGSDSKYNSAPGGYTDFNPRSRMGSDRERRHESASNSNFNPRSRTGSDVLHVCQVRRLQYFNPRSRTGSDGVSLKRCTNQANFNPRSRMGSDDTGNAYTYRNHYFNPRSRMGSDPGPFCGHGRADVFQSTLPHGERQPRHQHQLH